MRKARVFGQVLGVQGMVIEDVTVQTDPDGDEEILVVSVRPDARSAGRCATCRRRCPGYDAGVEMRRVAWRTVDTGTTRTFLQAAAPRVEARNGSGREMSSFDRCHDEWWRHRFPSG